MLNTILRYYTHEDAVDCMKYINGTRVDERVIRTDLDPGFREGRQYGRGKSGGQVRDEYRQEFDPGRGGWGHLKAQEEARRAALEQRMQAQLTHEVPTGQAMGAPLEAQGK
jgi:nuclear cap-binding protein subunit 2